MNMTIAKITAVVMVLVSVLCACAPVNVEAASTYALSRLVETQYDGGVCTVKYYAPLDYPNVLVLQQGNLNKKYHIAFYSNETTVSAASTGSAVNYNFSQNAMQVSDLSLEQIKTLLFEGGNAEQTETTTVSGMQKLLIYSKDLVGTTSSIEGAVSLESIYYDYYYEKNGEYPTFESENGDVSDEEEDNSGTISGGTIWDMLKAFWTNGNTFILDLAGEKINEKLADNKCFTSIISIRNTLTDLFNEDYTNPTGFYELGLTNITLGDTRKVEYVYEGGSHSVFKNEKYKIKIGTDKNGKAKYQEIDFGLENAKVLNLDWYFGGEVENGYYKNGMKTYIDGIISAFLWVMFAWALYKNMPNWIGGELTQIANLGGSQIREYNDSIMREEQELIRKENQQAYEDIKAYNNSYEAYKERMDRKAEYKQRYFNEKKGK